MSRKKLLIPRFENEKQEAIWWDKNRSAVEADLRAGMRNGRTVSLQSVLKALQKKAARQARG